MQICNCLCSSGLFWPAVAIWRRVVEAWGWWGHRRLLHVTSVVATTLCRRHLGRNRRTLSSASLPLRSTSTVAWYRLRPRSVVFTHGRSGIWSLTADNFVVYYKCTALGKKGWNVRLWRHGTPCTNDLSTVVAYWHPPFFRTGYN